MPPHHVMPRCPQPPQSGVGVTVVSLSLVAEDGDVGRLERLLSDAERSRAERCVPAVRRRFIIGRGRLRLLLAAFVGAPAEALDLRVGSHGKPALGGRFAGRCHFNLTHSRDRGMVAFSWESPVGIDLEILAPSHTPQWADMMAGSILGADEMRRWRELPDPLKPAALLEHWVVKEAIVKASGRGIGAGLRHVPLPVSPARIALPRAQEAVGVRLARIPPVRLASAPTTHTGTADDGPGVGLLCGEEDAFAALACHASHCRLSSTTFDEAVTGNGGFS
jgi:4'-phosphopantetheinyl transferase